MESKDKIIEYININAQKCSEDLIRNIIPSFQKTLENAINIAYKEGFFKGCQMIYNNTYNKNSKK